MFDLLCCVSLRVATPATYSWTICSAWASPVGNSLHLLLCIGAAGDLCAKHIHLALVLPAADLELFFGRFPPRTRKHVLWLHLGWSTMYLGQIRTNIVKHILLGQHRSKFGHVWSEFGQTWADFGQTRTKQAIPRSMFGQSGPEGSHVWHTSGRMWLISDKLGDGSVI